MKTRYMILISATLSALAMQANTVDAATVDNSSNGETEKVQLDDKKVGKNTTPVENHDNNKMVVSNNSIKNDSNNDLQSPQKSNADLSNTRRTTFAATRVVPSNNQTAGTAQRNSENVNTTGNIATTQANNSSSTGVKSGTDNDGYYNQMLDSWKDIVVGDKYYSNSNTAMNKISQQQDEKVTKLWDSMNNKDEEKDNLWAGATELTASANVTTDYRNLESMAVATANPGSKYYNNKKMIDDVVTGFNWLGVHKYNKNIKAYGNWWDWEIGSAQFLNNIVTIMHPYLTQQQIKDSMDALDYFVPDPYYFRGSVNPNSKAEVTGANQVDISKVKIIEALINKDEDGLREAIGALDKVFPIVNEGEGFYPDGSFIQHENIGYNGSYGNVLIDGVSQLATVLQNTPFALSDDAMGSVNFWVDKGFSPFIYKGNTMDMVRGRAISRGTFQSDVSGADLIRSIVRVSETLPSADKAKYQGLVKYWLGFGNNYNKYINQMSSYRDISLIESIMNDDSIKANDYQPNILYNFAVMDKVMMKNSANDYAVAINMSSTRIKRYEPMNNENIRGWYTGDGMVYAYNNDLSQFNDDYWATVDPYKLPGTTETDKIQKDGVGGTVSKTSFVGGSIFDNSSAIGNVGSVAMDFRNIDGDLTAHKSWFLTENGLISLGSAINNTSTANALTVIDNRKLAGNAKYTIYVNGKVYEPQFGQTKELENVTSIYLQSDKAGQSMGYKFITPQNINMALVNRKGAWSDINKAQSPNEVVRTYLEIFKVHQGENDTYNYVTYPNIGLDDFNSQVNPTIVQNDETAQIVKFGNNIGINVFKAGDTKTMGMEFATPVSVTRVNNGKQILFGVSDPSQNKKATTSFKVKDEGYKLTNQGNGIKASLVDGYWNISLTKSGHDGATHYFSLN